MSDPKNTESHPQPLALKDVARLLVKEYGLHEGLWDLAIEMQVAVGQFGAPDESGALPGAAMRVSRIGLTKTEAAKAGPLTVDASEVNPAKA